MSKKLYMDLMDIFSDRAPKLQENGSEDDMGQLANILLVIDAQLLNGDKESKIAALKWVNLMFTVLEKEMSGHIDTIFPSLVTILSDPNDEVVILSLRVLSVICKPTPEDEHFSKFMVIY